MASGMHKVTLPVANFDTVMGDGFKKVFRKRHGELFPDNVRAIVVGPSNSGKTNAVFNMLFHPNGLKFSNIYVFSKSLYQPKYKFLEDVVSGVEGVGYFSFTENETVIKPEETLHDSIMIFDDVICEKQNNITRYFTMGRHNDIDVLYLCQTYSRIPKQLVRDNANFLMVFRQDERNLKHIFHDHVTPDMSYERFKLLCRDAWDSTCKGFLTIDKEMDKDKGRYRFNFDSKIKVPE